MIGCLINTVENNIHIAFDTIVQNGFAEISRKQLSNQVIKKLVFERTNFVCIGAKLPKGRYLIKLNLDGKSIKKSITIS